MNRAKLSNGLTVLYHCTPQDPIAAGHLFFPTGSAYEAEEKWGTSSLLWSLFSKGTKQKTSRKFAEEIESIGSYVSAGSTLDYTEVSFHSTSDKMREAMLLMQEALLQPAFLDEHIEKERAAIKAQLRAKLENPFSMAHERLAGSLFPGDPYGRPSGGTDETISRLAKSDLESWHQHVVSPQGAVFSLASDLTFDAIVPMLEDIFGAKAWPLSPQKPVAKLPAVPHISDLKIHSSETTFEQACLMVGFQAPEVASDDYTALKIMNSILGGGMSTRLFQSLREKQGLAYDVSSFYPTKKRKSLFVIQMGLQPDKIEQAKKGIWAEINLLKSDLIPKEELLRTEQQIRGSFVLDHQTNSQRTHYRGWWEILGLGHDFDQKYLKRVSTVTSKDVLEAAQRLFSAPSITVEAVPIKKKALKVSA